MGRSLTRGACILVLYASSLGVAKPILTAEIQSQPPASVGTSGTYCWVDIHQRIRCLELSKFA